MQSTTSNTVTDGGSIGALPDIIHARMRLFSALFFVLAISRAIASDADCEVALWALRMNGSVVLEGDTRRIRDVADLPDGDFRIFVLNLIGTNMHPPHMEPFARLT